MSQQRILVVDDDDDYAQVVKQILVVEGYEVEVASNSREALENLPHSGLVLLDLDLGNERGYDVALEIIRHNPGLGIIIVAANANDADEILCLEIGADDYLVKPLEPRNLLAHIRSLFRRLTVNATPTGSEVYLFAGFRFDPASFHLTQSGTEVELTRNEMRLLELFVTRATRILSREFLSREVFHRDWSPAERNVDVLVGKLRRKLGDSGHGEFIKTWRGIGYQFAQRVERDHQA